MGDILQSDQHLAAIHPDLLSVEQLSALLHKSPASIRSDASRNPQALPPICRLPGNKRLLWRLEDIRGWLAQHVQHEAGQPIFSNPISLQTLPKKRGRPRKTTKRATA